MQTKHVRNAKWAKEIVNNFITAHPGAVRVLEDVMGINHVILCNYLISCDDRAWFCYKKAVKMIENIGYIHQIVEFTELKRVVLDIMATAKEYQ